MRFTRRRFLESADDVLRCSAKVHWQSSQRNPRQFFPEHDEAGRSFPLGRVHYATERFRNAEGVFQKGFIDKEASGEGRACQARGGRDGFMLEGKGSFDSCLHDFRSFQRRACRFPQMTCTARRGCAAGFRYAQVWGLHVQCGL